MSRDSFMTGFLALGLWCAGAMGPGAVAAQSPEPCQDESGLCLTPQKGAAWQSGEISTKKDQRRRGKGAAGSLTLMLDSGRGSVFVNGRYAGTAPLQEVPVPSGRNDLEVRDGSTVLARGVLTVPRGQNVAITVHHP